MPIKGLETADFRRDKNISNFHGLRSREIALTGTKKRLLSLAGVFILLYKLRKKRQKLKIRDLFVYLQQRERMWF